MQPENLNPLRSYLNTTTSARCSFENPNWGLHRFLNSLNLKKNHLLVYKG